MIPRHKNTNQQEYFKLVYDHRPEFSFASAVITCTAKANYIDGENMAVIKDGLGGTYTLEADPAGDGATGTAVDLSGDTTDIQVAARLTTALGTLTALTDNVTVTDNLDATITLTHKHPGGRFNISLTENVANANHTVAGFTGGKDTFHNVTEVFKLFTAERRIRVDRMEYLSRDGLAAHASNYWDVSLKKDATVVGEWSTETGEEGTLAADTLADATLAATDADRVIEVTDVVSLALTKTASAADLSPGRLVIHGRYV